MEPVNNSLKANVEESAAGSEKLNLVCFIGSYLSDWNDTTIFFSFE